MNDIEELATIENPRTRRHQRREWKAERIGWGAMAAVVAAALLGALGHGWLSSCRVTSADGTTTIEYYAVEHCSAPGQLVIHVATNQESVPLRLFVSRSFCDHVTIASFVPQPISSSIHDADILFVFGSASTTNAVIACRYEYDASLIADHRIRVEGRDAVEFRQYVLP